MHTLNLLLTNVTSKNLIFDKDIYMYIIIILFFKVYKKRLDGLAVKCSTLLWSVFLFFWRKKVELGREGHNHSFCFVI